jgi:hypothetical protein
VAPFQIVHNIGGRNIGQEVQEMKYKVILLGIKEEEVNNRIEEMVSEGWDLTQVVALPGAGVRGSALWGVFSRADAA